jgi:hypothetical protein
MREQSLAALTIVSIVLAACASSSTSSSAAPTAAGAPAGATAPGRTFTANLSPTGSTNSRMSGTITLSPVDANTFNVTLDLRSAPGNKQLPWAIRPGACGDMSPNSEIGGRGPYGAIQTGADGMAHVNTRIRVALPDQPMHVDIMQSNSQRDVILTCGLLAGR